MSRADEPGSARAAARELCSPSDYERQRVRSKLAQSISDESYSPTVLRVERAIVSGAPITGTAVLARIATFKKLVGAVLLIAAGLGAWSLSSREPSPVPAPAVTQSARAAAKPASSTARAGMPVATGNDPQLAGDEAKVLPPRPQLSAASEAELAAGAAREHEALHAEPNARRSPAGLRPARPSVPRTPPGAHPSAARGSPRDIGTSEPPAPLPPALEPAAPRPQPVAAASHHLGEELRLMRSASAAIVERDWARARSELDSHAQRFQTGSLTQEREGLRLIVRCKQAGPSPKLERDRNAFLLSAAESPIAARVREACEASR